MHILSYSNTSSSASRTTRRRITKVGSTTNPAPASDDVADVDMEATQVAERKVVDRYPPDQLPDHQGPYFAHERAKLVQWDYKDVDGTLIAPHELYSKLTEGTLVLLTVSLVTLWKGGMARSRISSFPYLLAYPSLCRRSTGIFVL
ncbi:hypothetical protein B0H11DRAFT_1077136 [Mycena galericulata]|nr:hypothetical protein B0H11DRAFT_1077136 [Mycena galericulata]